MFGCHSFKWRPPPNPTTIKEASRPKYKHFDPNHPAVKRRIRKERERQGEKRDPGRPRSENPQNPKDAKRLRIRRLNTKIDEVLKRGSSHLAQFQEQNPDTWAAAFAHSPVNTLLQTARARANTPSGSKSLPDVAEGEAKRQMYEETGRGTCEMIRDGRFDSRGGCKLNVCSMTLKYVQNIALFAAECEVRKGYAAKAKRNIQVAPCLKLCYSLKTTPASYRREAGAELSKVIEVFFLRHSQCRSGQRDRKRSKFREVPMKYKDLGVKWYSFFPEYCREAAQMWPKWAQGLSTKRRLTQFEASVVAAVNSTPANSHGIEREIRLRQQEAIIHYSDKLRQARLAWRGASLCNSTIGNAEYDKRVQETEQAQLDELEQLDKDGTDIPDVEEENVSLSLAKVKVPKIELVFKVVKKLGYSWSQNVYPTECPIHDKGPVCVVEFENKTKALTKALADWEDAQRKLYCLRENKDVRENKEGQQNTEDAATAAAAVSEASARAKWSEMLGEVRKLDDEKRTYERHCKQYKVCRGTIKQIEARLKPGEAVLYRDFVSQYMTGGAKLSNLVFVVLWHDETKVGKFKKVMKFNHLCDDKGSRSQDSYYTIDVWRWFLGSGKGHSNFLKRNNIHTLFVSGDHGPHFSSCATMYMESCFFEEFGIRLHLFFLCSYHAFNRCDGAEPAPGFDPSTECPCDCSRHCRPSQPE